MYLFNICRENPKVTFSNASWVSVLYLCSSRTTLTPGFSTKTLPANALLHFQTEPYMGWEGVKKPFSIPIFQSRISTSSTSQEWQYLCHKLLVLQKSGHTWSWVTPAILFILLRRNTVNYPGSPDSWEKLENHCMVHSSQGLRTEGKHLCPTFGSFFLLRRTKIADVEGMVRATMASLCPSKLGPSPAVLVLEGRSCLSVECSPKWVPYSRTLIAVENIYEWAYLMKWFVDPKKLLYLIKSTAQEI